MVLRKIHVQIVVYILGSCDQLCISTGYLHRLCRADREEQCPLPQEPRLQCPHGEVRATCFPCPLCLSSAAINSPLRRPLMMMSCHLIIRTARSVLGANKSFAIGHMPGGMRGAAGDATPSSDGGAFDGSSELSSRVGSATSVMLALPPSSAGGRAATAAAPARLPTFDRITEQPGEHQEDTEAGAASNAVGADGIRTVVASAGNSSGSGSEVAPGEGEGDLSVVVK